MKFRQGASGAFEDVPAGPKGDTGPQGEPGATGSTGPAGDTGPAGLSPSYFVGIGNQFSTIQSAIDAAILAGANPDTGATIYIAPGYYAENLVITGGGISLVGPAAQSVFIDGTCTFNIDAPLGVFPQYSLTGVQLAGAVTVSGPGAARAYFSCINTWCSARLILAYANIEVEIVESILRAPSGQADALLCSVPPLLLRISGGQIGRGNIDSRACLINAASAFLSGGSVVYGWVELTGASVGLTDWTIYADGHATIDDGTSSISEIYGCTFHLNDPAFVGINKTGSSTSNYGPNFYADSATAPFVATASAVRLGHVPSIDGIIEVPGSITLTQAHVVGDTVLLMTGATDDAVTLQPIAGLQVGCKVSVVREGAGNVQFVASGGASFEPSDRSYIGPWQYGRAELLYIGANRWRISGDLDA